MFNCQTMIESIKQTFPWRSALSACSMEECPLEGQSGSPSASLTKKSVVSGVISASKVPNGAEEDSFEAPKKDPFSFLFKLLSSNTIAQQAELNNLFLHVPNRAL